VGFEIEGSAWLAVKEQGAFVSIGRPDDGERRVTLAERVADGVVDVDSVEDQIVGVEVEGVEIRRLAVVIEEGPVSTVGSSGSSKEIVSGQKSLSRHWGWLQFFEIPVLAVALSL
jgi:hypothetical protein